MEVISSSSSKGDFQGKIVNSNQRREYLHGKEEREYIDNAYNFDTECDYDCNSDRTPDFSMQFIGVLSKNIDLKFIKTIIH